MAQINPNFPKDSFKAHIFIGGLPIEDDRFHLEKEKNTKIGIGTLGRTCVLLKEESLDLSEIKVLVLDEADKLIGEKA